MARKIKQRNVKVIQDEQKKSFPMQTFIFNMQPNLLWI